MKRPTKGLRSPLLADVRGRQVQMLTVGHMALAINRSTWTVRYWERAGLLPVPPFALHQYDAQRRRWLYPQPFVEAVAEIIKRNQIGDRLDRKDWAWFRDEVFAAFERTVQPLLTCATADAGPVSA